MCDDKKFSLSFCPITINEEHEKYNTLHHDITAVQETIDNIPLVIPSYVKIKIAGDKAYSTSEKFTICNQDQCIITPLKEPRKTKKEIKELEDKINSIKKEEQTKIENIRTDYTKQFAELTKKSKNDENKCVKNEITNKKMDKINTIKEKAKTKITQIKLTLSKSSKKEKEKLQNKINDIKSDQKKKYLKFELNTISNLKKTKK
jgi:hypothetical protein